MRNKNVSVAELVKKVEVSVQVRQAKLGKDAPKPAGPLFSFLIGAGFSLTAGLSSVNHLVRALELFKSNKDLSWQEIFDLTLEASFNEEGRTGSELTDHYFHVMGDVLPLPQARHDFITAAIQWASSRRVQMNMEGILLATILMAGTGRKVPLNPRKKKRHWLPHAFARHVFTTNFDEVLPNTFYYGNQAVEILDSGSRSINAAAEYPTVVYLHGRHLHYDIRNTKHELHSRRGVEQGQHDLFTNFRSLLKTTGLIVIGYSGAKDLVTQIILEALEDPESLPYGLWWAAYPDDSAIHKDVRKAINGHERAFFLDPGKDAEQVLRTLSMNIGIDGNSAVSEWRERLRVVSQEVERFLERATFDFRKFQLDATQALFLSSKSMAQTTLREWELMRDHILDHADKLLVADLLSLAARLMVMVGKADAAEVTYLEALELLEKLGDSEKRAGVLMGYGELKLLMMNYKQAGEAFQRSLKLYEQLGRKLGTAELRTKMGELYLACNEPKKAESEYQQGLKVCESVGYALGTGRNLAGLAEVQFHRKELGGAVEKLNEALALHRNDGSEVHIIRDLRSLAYVHIELRDFELAEESIREAIDIARSNALEREIARSLVAKATLLLEQDQLEEAGNCVTESLKLLDNDLDVFALVQATKLKKRLDKIIYGK